jgi:hypothetical protein
MSPQFMENPEISDRVARHQADLGFVAGYAIAGFTA